MYNISSQPILSCCDYLYNEKINLTNSLSALSARAVDVTKIHETKGLFQNPSGKIFQTEVD